MPNRLLRAVLVVGLLFLASGCFRMQMELTVNEDHTVSGSMVTAVSAEALAAMAAFSESDSTDPRELWEEMNGDSNEDLPPGATVEAYAQDGYIGDRIVFADTPLSEMQSVMASEGGEFSLVHEDGSYVFTMDFNPDTSAMGGSDLLTESDMALFSTLYGQPEFRVSVTFPGEVTEHNGELDGTTVTWNRDLLSADPEPMTATAEESGASSPKGPGGDDGDGENGGGGESSDTTSAEDEATAAVAAGLGLGGVVLVLSVVGMGMGIQRALRG